MYTEGQDSYPDEFCGDCGAGRDLKYGLCAECRGIVVQRVQELSYTVEREGQVVRYASERIARAVVQKLGGVLCGPGIEPETWAVPLWYRKAVAQAHKLARILIQEEKRTR